VNEPATDKLDHGAVFDGPYRYLLWRTLSPLINSGTILFVMLNPSTATATDDDPTIRRVKSFANLWGYRTLEVVNAFAIRSTDPVGLLSVEDPVGLDNDDHIREAATRADKIVVAWGAAEAIRGKREKEVLSLLGDDVHCLGTTQGGHPKHPLYVPAKTKPILYKPIEMSDA